MAGNEKSGRRTMAEELKLWKEGLKRATIEELAESKIYNHLKEYTDSNDKQGVKEIALPVYLKSKPETHIHKFPKPLLNGRSNNNSDKKTTSPKEKT